MRKPQMLPKPGLLRWEIGVALAIKLILLMGLWWLLFHWQNRLDAQQDIAAHLALPADNVVSSQPKP